MRGYRRSFIRGDFEITKREIIASISIIAIMMLIGILISSKITEHQLDKNEVYNKAIKIDNDKELFQYGMNTNVGNAFVYGTLKAVDAVTYDEIGGQYMSVKKVKEKYTKHTKRVKRGKKWVTKTYWKWDKVKTWTKHCDKVTFLDIEFDFDDIYDPHKDYITKQSGGHHIRYVYYGSKLEYTGTIFTKLKDGTINDTSFYNGATINETVDNLESNIGVIIFSIIWIIGIGGAVFGFYYLDNRWLE